MWSWNEISCSIIGDALSCRFMFAHVVISKKSLRALCVELKSTALICQNRLIKVDYFSITIVGNSEYLCSAGGRFCSHSIEFLVCVGKRICRFVLILSHTMKMNIRTLTNEVVAPTEETIFHVV